MRSTARCQATADCNTYVQFDNFYLADGILTVGGKYFLSYSDGTPENDKYLSDREVAALPTLVGDGLIFEGWYTTPDFREGTKVLDPNTMPAGTVFYAKTSSIYKNIHYELAGGTITGEYPTKFLPTEGASITLPTNVTLANAIFTGWYDNPNFEGDPITELSIDTDSDITVWARYRMVLSATLVSNPGVQAIKNTDGTVDYLIGVSSDAVAASGTANNGVQGQIKGSAITDVTAKRSTHFGLSFRIEKESEAFPCFVIRFRCADKKQHTYLINFWGDGDIGLFASPAATKPDNAIIIGSYADGPKDLYFDITVDWASRTGVADGKITISAFVNDEYVGTYDKTVKIANPSSYLQVYSEQKLNPHINATNGTLLTDGIPNAGGADEERTTLYSGDAEGHYAIVRLGDVRIYSGAKRETE